MKKIEKYVNVWKSEISITLCMYFHKFIQFLQKKSVFHERNAVYIFIYLKKKKKFKLFEISLDKNIRTLTFHFETTS